MHGDPGRTCLAQQEHSDKEHSRQESASAKATVGGQGTWRPQRLHLGEEAVRGMSAVLQVDVFILQVFPSPLCKYLLRTVLIS